MELKCWIISSCDGHLVQQSSHHLEHPLSHVTMLGTGYSLLVQLHANVHPEWQVMGQVLGYGYSCRKSRLSYRLLLLASPSQGTVGIWGVDQQMKISFCFGICFVFFNLSNKNEKLNS